MKERRPATTQLLLIALLSGLSAFVIMARVGAEAGEHEPQTAAEMWLSWNPETRASYVRGYLSGFQRGKREGCSFRADQIAAQSQQPLTLDEGPESVCMKALPEFTAPYFQVYVEAITTYYTKYPRDREAGIPQILSQLASPPSLTIDQIHAKFNAHPKD